MSDIGRDVEVLDNASVYEQMRNGGLSCACDFCSCNSRVRIGSSTLESSSHKPHPGGVFIRACRRSDSLADYHAR
jgi:hypothetical protein